MRSFHVCAVLWAGLAKSTYSNYGSRIDVNAEGDNHVVTTGYGFKYPGIIPPAQSPSVAQIHEWYTAEWADTSAATAQVAPALAHLNAIAESYHGAFLSSATLREIARQSGTPYTGSLEIGRRPDLKKQVARVESFFLHTGSTNYVGGASAPGPDFVNWDQGTGLWTVKDPINGNSTSFVFGSPGQIPVVADFSAANGALADIVVYDPPTGQWIQQGGTVIGAFAPFGIPIPVEMNARLYGPELSVFRPFATSAYNNPNGKSEWTIRTGFIYGIWPNPGRWAYKTVEWGDSYAYALPLAGDFLDDSRDEIVVINPSPAPGGTTVWHVLGYPYDPATSPQVSFGFGAWNDIYLTCRIPNTAGGKATRAAVYRPSDGRFIVRVPEAPTGTVSSTIFGKPGDVPSVSVAPNCA